MKQYHKTNYPCILNHYIMQINYTNAIQRSWTAKFSTRKVVRTVSFLPAMMKWFQCPNWGATLFLPMQVSTTFCASIRNSSRDKAAKPDATRDRISNAHSPALQVKKPTGEYRFTASWGMEAARFLKNA